VGDVWPLCSFAFLAISDADGCLGVVLVGPFIPGIPTSASILLIVGLSLLVTRVTPAVREERRRTTKTVLNILSYVVFFEKADSIYLFYIKYLQKVYLCENFLSICIF